MKKWILFPLSFLLMIPALILGHLLYLYTHLEFTVDDFQVPFLLESQESSFLDEKEMEGVNRVLNQRYSYLACGKQMTAFESADHRYVIKFFNPRPVLKKRWFRDSKKWRRFSSLKWISNAYFKRKERLTKLYQRYQMGFEELKEEAGLVFVHLKPSTSLLSKMHLVDKGGKSHQIDLDTYPFVLQKKATLVTCQLDLFIRERNFEGIKRSIEQLRTLFLSRAKKGFTDRIQTLHNNYGFVDELAVQIDLGRIRKDESVQKMPEQEFEKVFSEVFNALSQRYVEIKDWKYRIPTCREKNSSQ